MTNTMEAGLPFTHNQSPNDTTSLIELYTQLDVLWEQYLNVVDQYQQAQQQVQKYLSDVSTKSPENDWGQPC